MVGISWVVAPFYGDMHNMLFQYQFSLLSHVANFISNVDKIFPKFAQARGGLGTAIL